ncbi:predicted protein [Micromonas commoda]|uniref:NADP-dependent oxidoreductase domain-containing protein n=1 Tax=Micromonas commoda (strain RCC299 / NOUM17 / CCMP2709) TaxID=296587 RepID=C1FFN0_MICCC|nr:predicted protein [Micromonas commoda]ACO69110.1 predicted protein [Micromonas commoda]|eukprot:XP_002507852.1 predicted protein [Micromonas commoda]
MPALGLGTWKIAAGDTTAAVLSALRCGYRLLDCAPVYGNQPQVGAAIQQALDEGTLRSRDELFVTSKLMTQTLEPTDFEAAVRTSLAELGVDYLDLALLQWPAPQRAPIAEQWCAMEALVDAGLARHIGVSNFSAKKLGELMDGSDCRIPPAVNQVECGAHFRQERLLRWCVTRGVVVQAYGPLGSGDQFSSDGMGRERSGAEPVDHPAVINAAKATGMTRHQVLLRWNVGRGNVCVIPKSANPERQLENLRAVTGDTALPPEHADAIGSFEEQYRLQHGSFHTGPGKPYRTLADLWDEDVGYMKGREFERPEGFALR